MGIFRSDDMTLFQISIPKDDAWDILHRLGQIDCLHFVDLNADEQVFNLKFASYIKRMEDTMLRLLKVESECQLNDIHLTRPASFKDFMSTLDDLASSNQVHPSLLFEQIEKDSIEHVKFINSQLDSVQKI